MHLITLPTPFALAQVVPQNRVAFDSGVPSIGVLAKRTLVSGLTTPSTNEADHCTDLWLELAVALVLCRIDRGIGVALWMIRLIGIALCTMQFGLSPLLQSKAHLRPSWPQ